MTNSEADKEDATERTRQWWLDHVGCESDDASGERSSVLIMRVLERNRSMDWDDDDYEYHAEFAHEVLCEFWHYMREIAYVDACRLLREEIREEVAAEMKQSKAHHPEKQEQPQQLGLF